jgi:hypothetical protein
MGLKNNPEPPGRGPMNTLSAEIPKLSAAKLELLARRLREKGRQAAYAPPISRRHPSISRPPLSFEQQRLWFLQQLDPNNASYNIPLSVRFRGALNVAVLRRALSEVVRRHEILRTSFEDIDGQPMQIISPAQPVNFPVVDLRELPEQERAEQVARHRRREVQTQFDLAIGPLWRAKLLRVGTEEHLALFTMHHAISDGWSMNVLVNELGQLYDAFAAGRPSPLEELPVQYADYAIWQREWLQGEVLQTQLDYWRSQLADAPADLHLPTDRPAPATRTTAAALLEFTIPPEVGARIKEICRNEEATLFMVMLAALALLLSRYSGQENVLIGTVIAGRHRLELEKLIGFFVNTLVMRVDLNGSHDFRDLLNRVRQTTLAAYAHQDVPFEKLVSELQPERSLSQNPFFNTLLMVQNMPRSGLNLKNLQIDEIVTDTVAAKFDLSLAVAEFDTGLSSTIVYSTDLFDASTVARMAETLNQILREATGLAAGPIEATPVTGELLNAFTATLE